MNAITDYWTSNGSRIVRDDRDSPDAPELVVERETDGFRIDYMIVKGDDGTAHARFLTNSPCITA